MRPIRISTLFIHQKVNKKADVSNFILRISFCDHTNGTPSNMVLDGNAYKMERVAYHSMKKDNIACLPASINAREPAQAEAIEDEPNE
jgi:hypothetical protein